MKRTIKVKELNLANFMLFTVMVQERHDDTSCSNQKHRNMEDFTPVIGSLLIQETAAPLLTLPEDRL